jgi:monoamine oxidase
VGGARLRVRPNEELDLHNVPLALTDKERQLGLGGMVEEYLLRPAREMADPRSPGWPAKDLADIDRLTSAEFLRSRGASQAATELLLLPFELAEADGTSALWVLRDMLLSESQATLSKIHGGNDRLPYAFASRLGKDIRYGRAVSRIEQAEKSVRAVCTTRSGVETVEGDALICAIPFSVLRRVEVSPPWPKDKDDAIRELRYDPATRVYLQLADRRWEAKGLNGFAVTDFPDEIWHPTHDQPGRSGILMSYGCGSRARAFGERPDPERVKVTRERFEQAFEGLAPTQRHHSFVWDDEEWNRGAISLHAPGQLTRFAEVAGRREGRVWFAGEHLSAWPGWMQGALDSGNRVADEINQISADQLAARETYLAVGR